MQYEAVVIGVSAGGLMVLSGILKELPGDYPMPLIVIQHRSKDERTLLEEVLQDKCVISIRQANEKERIDRSKVYFAPPDYHLLIERDHTFSLTCDDPVNFSRPSIDLLFETASEVYKDKLVAVILTGANRDGAEGIRAVRQRGGLTIAQDPATALFPDMPRAAIDTGSVQHILNAAKIKDLLLQLAKNRTDHA
ncbi:chemotaxis protein CheB [Flavitalea sp. BT771]|uniref:chemotaxis protein CheB n=1 Tax=Flavitalea sp. BT771 TaxID=3063329 RepID=UPI0026E319A7|nr:chemotaxis protein CheB [Flavitalea sp. BT771]MDO6432733.1 chemotaxis protein CheB [Flavitalea sp. BT771]MDV6221991.1 chemotaxis protein CheB [Flavitalea sp. BT771]